jgi:hypothetical protein
MKNTKEFYSEIAKSINWYKNTEDFIDNAIEKIARLEKMLPYGSGFDNGSKIDLEKSTDQKIIIITSFHHVNEYGHYIGWTEHKVIITSCLKHGFQIKITGINKNRIKDYLYDVFTNIIK